MNYQRVYDNLIAKAKNRILEGYQEKHHIIPKCMGGGDNIENLIGLTPEEHFVAHQLLVKIYPNENKLIYACAAMVYHDSKNRINNKMYGWLKRKRSKVVSEQFREHWADDEKRKAHIESMRKRNQTEAAKLAKSIQAKEVWKKASKERKNQVRKIQKENNAKVAEKNRELWQDKSFREKMKAARTGIFWWTDGVTDIKSKKCPGDNFSRGRSSKNLGRKRNG
jgi:hypothetical protein